MPILSWYEDKNDNKLFQLIPVLKAMSEVNDVRPILLECCSKDNVFNCDKAVRMCDKLVREVHHRKHHELDNNSTLGE